MLSLPHIRKGSFSRAPRCSSGRCLNIRAIPFKEAQIEERLAAELRQFETPAVGIFRGTRLPDAADYRCRYENPDRGVRLVLRYGAAV